jgi:gamma-glutamylcyclotransferase (GGCT)/AIG2-like uncharacterized protein YtfP
MSKVILYGVLKENQKFNFLIPKESSYKKIKLKGYQMYNLGTSPGVIKGQKNDLVSCELCEFNISKLKERWYFLILDIFEGTYKKRYIRKKIIFENEKVWMYIYNRKITHEKRIYNW